MANKSSDSVVSGRVYKRYDDTFYMAVGSGILSDETGSSNVVWLIEVDQSYIKMTVYEKIGRLLMLLIDPTFRKISVPEKIFFGSVWFKRGDCLSNFAEEKPAYILQQ
jgi:hypothetical protein